MKLSELKEYQILSISEWKEIEQELSGLHQHAIHTIPHTTAANITANPFEPAERNDKMLELPINKYTVVIIQKVINDEKTKEIPLSERPPSILFFVETDFSSKKFLSDN